jgi:hypothetical protein
MCGPFDSLEDSLADGLEMWVTVGSWVYSVRLSGGWCARLVAERVGVGWLGMHSKGVRILVAAAQHVRTDAQHSTYSTIVAIATVGVCVYVIKSHTNWTSSLSREGPSLTVATDLTSPNCLIHGGPVNGVTCRSKKKYPLLLSYSHTNNRISKIKIQNDLSLFHNSWPGKLGNLRLH